MSERADEPHDVTPDPGVEPVPAGVDLTRGEAQLEAAAEQLRTLPPTERAAQAAGRILRRALSAPRRAVPVATTDPQLEISSVAIVAVLRDALDRGLVDAAVQRIALDVDDRVLRSVRVELVVRYRSPMPDVADVAQDVVRAALVDVLGAGPAPGADDVERHVHVADVTMADPRLTEPVDEEVPPA